MIGPLLWSLALLSNIIIPTRAYPLAPDPCETIAGKQFVLPSDALACYKSFPFNETLRQNILTNVARVMNFFTFEAFYRNSPPPFEDSTIDIRAELSRINTTQYATDYDFNKDLYDTTLRMNDGHTRWFPTCYITFQSILPAPFVSLEVSGVQSVYVAPDSVEFLTQVGPEFTGFFDSIGFDWKRLAGARVLTIEGMPAYDYADLTARTVSGNFLDRGIRFNSAFTSYRIAETGNITSFSQRLGDMAGPISVTRDHLTLTIIPQNASGVETVVVPFLASYISETDFTNRDTYWAANCAVRNDTNGVDLLATVAPPVLSLASPAERTRSQEIRAEIIDMSTFTAVDLPQPFQPSLPPVGGSSGLIRSFLLPDNKTGVMFVGSFSDNFTRFQVDVDSAVNQLKAAGATHLLIDVHNNGGGFVCLGAFLHQYLVGSDFAVPGFQSTSRANPLAQKILASLIQRGVRGDNSVYIAENWLFVNGTPMGPTINYNNPSAPFVINGVDDPTSQRFVDNCVPSFRVTTPRTAPFPLTNVAIVSNGVCASTCALFTTIMHELHSTVIAVFGGPPGRDMEYKGMAGNQVLEWSDLDTEIRTAGLKQDPLAPPDLLISGNFRHNWRTAWSFFNESQAIAYRSDRPDRRFSYTVDTYNNPLNLWLFARDKLFGTL